MKFTGVGQILRFNYPMFLAAAAAVAVGVSVMMWAERGSLLWWLAVLGTSLTSYWAFATLAVSHWVYDRFPVFRFGWVPAESVAEMKRWANISTGFDQSSEPLRGLFSGAMGVPVDLFDEKVMTEPSIRRARTAYALPAGAVAGTFDRLPLEDGTMDVMFGIFAVHELRESGQRVALFCQMRCVLKPGGHIVVVEHLRSAANLAVFGPGAFHFHSRQTWRRDAAAAGLTLVAEIPLTPFATGLVWRREA